MGPPSPLPPLQGAFPHCRSSRGSPSNHGAPEPENGPHGAGAGGGSAPWGAGAGVSTPRRAPQALTRALSSSPDDPEGAFVPPEFDVTGNTFEVSGRRPGGQRGKGCREPAQPAPGRDRGCPASAWTRGDRAPSTGVSYGGAGTAAPLRRPRAGDGAGAWAGARPAGGGGRAAGEGPGRPSERCLGAPSHTTCPGDRQHGPRRGRGAERTPCRWGVSQVPGRLWPAADSGRLRPFILLLSRRGPRALPLAEGPVWAQQAVGRGRHPPPRMDGTVPLRGHLSCGGGAPSLWARLGAGCTRLCPREGASPPPPSWGGGVCFLSCSASHGLTVAPPTGEEGLLRAPTRVQVRPPPGLRGLCSAPGQPRSGTRPQGLADPWAVRVLHCGAVTPVWHPSCPCLGTEWHSRSWQSQLLCR